MTEKLQHLEGQPVGHSCGARDNAKSKTKMILGAIFLIITSLSPLLLAAGVIYL